MPQIAPPPTGKKSKIWLVDSGCRTGLCDIEINAIDMIRYVHIFPRSTIEITAIDMTRYVHVFDRSAIEINSIDMIRYQQLFDRSAIDINAIDMIRYVHSSLGPLDIEINAIDMTRYVHVFGWSTIELIAIDMIRYLQVLARPAIETNAIDMIRYVQSIGTHEASLAPVDPVHSSKRPLFFACKYRTTRCPCVKPYEHNFNMACARNFKTLMSMASRFQIMLYVDNYVT